LPPTITPTTGNFEVEVEEPGARVEVRQSVPEMMVTEGIRKITVASLDSTGLAGRAERVAQI
jgi:hypothetical protein